MKKIGTSLVVLVVMLLTIAGAAAEGRTDSFSIATNDFTGDQIAGLGDQFPQQDGTSANVRVVPPEGEAGSTHTILASGLQANQAVTVRIIRDETGSQVYSTERTANPNGRLELEIFTTRQDAPGEYTVQVEAADGTLLGEGTLTITPPPDPTGTASVSPERAPAGSTHQIMISDVPQFEDLRVLVRDSNANTVFEERVRATVDGSVMLRYRSALDAEPGTYEVVVLRDDDGMQLAATTLTVDEAIETTVTLSVSPASVAQGNNFSVQVTGLDANSSPVLQIVQNATGEIIYDRVRDADADGNLTVTLATESSDAPGDYTVRVLQDNVTAAEAALTISEEEVTDAAATDEPEGATLLAQVDVFPQTLVPGDDVFVTVSTLQPREMVTVELVAADGEIIDERDLTADINGNAIYTVTVPDDVALGQIDVTVVRGEQTIAEGTFRVESAPVADADVTLTVEPPTGVRGTDHVITASGLAPNAQATLNVLLDGENVYSTTLMTDADGQAQISLTSEESDAEGDYTVEIIQDGETLATSTLTIEAQAVQPEVTPEATAAPAEEAADDVTITVTPDVAEQGTTQQVRVEGLAAGDQVQLEVLYEGDVVYSTQRTADPTGTLIVNLVAEEGDPEGLYVVRVVQADTILVTTNFVVGTGAAQPPGTETPIPAEGVTVDITPRSGGRGTLHTVRVTGLNASETVTLNVLFDNEIVFSTNRTADANGTAQLELRTEENDPIGEYVVEVMRDDAVVASSTLDVTGEITEGDNAAPPDDAEATVFITPDRGAIGTLHTITVTELEPDVRYTIDVVYEGDIVFTTERNASADGEIILTLTAEANDDPGTYTVEVKRADTVIAAGDFIVEAAAAQPSPTPADGEPVTVDVTPTSGTIGTVHQVTVNGLNPGETVTIEVRFMGEVIFMTQATADDTGVAVLPLQSEEGDAAGDYTVAVLRDDTQVASGQLVIEEQVAQPDEATPTPTPAPEEPTPSPTQAVAGTESQVLTDRLTTNSPSRAYTFQGEAGDEVVLSLISPDFDSFLVLEDNNGVELARGDDTADSLDAQIGPYTLPYSGSYTVIATSFSYSDAGIIMPGAYRLTIERITTGTIGYGETVNIELDETTFGSYLTFQATAGDVLSVTVNSDGSVDTELDLIAPDGVVVASNDDGGAGFDPELSRFTVATDGEYTLAVRAFNPGAAGQADVTLTQTGTSTLADETRTIRLDSKQSSETLILQGISGEEIQLNLSLVDGEPGDLAVVVVQGEDTLMNYSTASGIPDTLTLGFVVPRDGNVIITVSDDTGAVSTLDVSINRMQP